MLVEDNALHFDKMEEHLNNLGHVVLRKENEMPLTSYEDALSALQRNRFIDLALLDIILRGEKTGIDIAEYILKTGLSIKIVFTTFRLDKEVAAEIAWLGPQFSVIPKVDNTINNDVFNFEVIRHLSPSDPLQQMLADNIYVQGIMVNSNIAIKPQMPQGKFRYGKKSIYKNNIQCIKAGKRWEIPKNYVLLVSTKIKEACLVHLSLETLITTLDYRFVQVNENTCVNLHFFDSYLSNFNKHEVLIASFPYAVTKKFRPEFEKRLSYFTANK